MIRGETIDESEYYSSLRLDRTAKKDSLDPISEFMFFI